MDRLAEQQRLSERLVLLRRFLFVTTFILAVMVWEAWVQYDEHLQFCSQTALSIQQSTTAAALEGRWPEERGGVGTHVSCSYGRLAIPTPCIAACSA